VGKEIVWSMTVSNFSNRFYVGNNITAFFDRKYRQLSTNQLKKLFDIIKAFKEAFPLRTNTSE
jgi:hypothetical protein